MDTQKLPQRPRLLPWTRTVSSPGRVLCYCSNRLVKFEGKACDSLLPELLALLDGNRSRSDIVGSFPEEHRTSAEEAMVRLNDHRLLLDGPAEDRNGATHGGLHFICLPERANPNDVSARLKGATVDVYGASGVAARMMEQLGELGIGRVLFHEELGDAAARERPSLAVVAPAAHQIGALPAWNRGAVAAQVPWLFASADFGTQGFAGPLFLPPETGCYECFARRRQSHSFLKDNFDNLDGGLRAGDAPFFFIDLLAGLATSLSARWLVSSDPIIPGRCQVIDAGRICEVSTHLLYKVPRCTVCSAATSISPVAPWGIKAKAEEPRR